MDFEIDALLVYVMGFILRVFALSNYLLKANVLTEIPIVSRLFSKALVYMTYISEVRPEAYVKI